MISTISFVTIGSACFSGLALAQGQDKYAPSQPQYATPEYRQGGYVAPQYQQGGYAAPQYQQGGYGYNYQAYKPSSGSLFAAKFNAHEDGAYITKNTKVGTWSDLDLDDHTISLNKKHIKLGETNDKHEVTHESYDNKNLHANAKYFQKEYPARYGGGYGHKFHHPSGSIYGVKAGLRGNDASFSRKTTLGKWSNRDVDDKTITFNNRNVQFHETKDKHEDTMEKFHKTNKNGSAKVISKKYGKDSGVPKIDAYKAGKN